MTIFDVLNLIGGLCLFLFGMNIMGEALERRAGNKLELLLGKLTSGKVMGLITGLAVTAVIQSSSATTVMVVGFVNSGLMTLKQAINVIMGANIGTTVTAWILSLGGIESSNIFVQLLKPTSFTPVLALVGVIFYMFCKSHKKKDTGMILLGFAVLMFGMDTMSASVSGLKEVEEFRNLFLLFKNPVLGVIAGAVLTAVIQSSSASVGILQALSVTGQVSYGAVIPIVMGQNIGTCITAVLSSFGTNKNAKRAAMVHLSFNVVGTVVWLTAYCIVDAVLSPALFDMGATHFGIAVAHSIFNILCVILLLPMSGLLEKLAYRLVPETKTPDVIEELDERLLATPAVALERCHVLLMDMVSCAADSLKEGIQCFHEYSSELAESVKEKEEKTDHYEDIIGSYLVKLSSQNLDEAESTTATKFLKLIGDFERISDHAANLVENAEEMRDKELDFSEQAKAELGKMFAATEEILDITKRAFVEDDVTLAGMVEPLEQVIDRMKENLRTNHILRLGQGDCSIETGFVWQDLLTNLERTSDHCSNIAGCILDAKAMNLHESLRALKVDNAEFKKYYEQFARKYLG